MGLPELPKDKRCYNCGTCYMVCKRQAINMKINDEGALIPYIDKTLCINCKVCEKNCPALVSRKNNGPISVYAATLKDKNLLKKCASGGAFTAFAKQVINNGGIVVGVVDDLYAGIRYKVATNEYELCEMQGTKYCQSLIESNLIQTISKNLLKRTVLFCGLPCQVAAVKNIFTNHDSDNLILIDLICGGAPPYSIVKLYRQYIEKKNKKKLVYHKFRIKSNIDRRQYVAEYLFDDGSKVQNIGSKDLYTRAFTSNIFMRECCYNCGFVGLQRVGDITIGDFWGIGSKIPYQGNIKDGVSLVICNTLKGKRFFEENQFLEYTERTVEEAQSGNIPLHRKIKRPLVRYISYKILKIAGFRVAVSFLCWRYNLKTMIKFLQKE